MVMGGAWRVRDGKRREEERRGGGGGKEGGLSRLSGLSGRIKHIIFTTLYPYHCIS